MADLRFGARMKEAANIPMMAASPTPATMSTGGPVGVEALRQITTSKKLSLLADSVAPPEKGCQSLDSAGSVYIGRILV